MSYPYGATVSPQLPDLPYTVIQRRQGDVKATLIPITLNGVPVNISGWSFIFSVTLPTGVQSVTWTVQSPSTGNPITTVAGTGFTIPGFNSTVTVTFASTSQMTSGNQILITGAGVFTIQSVLDTANAVLLNAGLSGNLSSGTIATGTNVFQIGQQGMTVLVIPSSITTAATGLYPCYLKYDTADPPPGPYKTTFLQGSLQILANNNPNA